MSSANPEVVRWQGPELINPDQALLAEQEPEAIREAAYAEGLALGLKEGEKQGSGVAEVDEIREGSFYFALMVRAASVAAF